LQQSISTKTEIPLQEQSMFYPNEIRTLLFRFIAFFLGRRMHPKKDNIRYKKEVVSSYTHILNS
ncbi:hypothetical protein, partial [Flavobacterium columnare]|uniref:hypothetical protein n=1 Tax=Flavobacterium columnare TaxID=996 RepID=UPI001C994291